MWPLNDKAMTGKLLSLFVMDVGWRAKSQKSSDDDFRRLLLVSAVSMYEFRCKTPQSDCETKRITSKN